MKKTMITLTLIILLVFVGTTVLASDTPNVTPKVTVSATQVSEGGNLSVTLSVDNITFAMGINSVVLTVDYNDDLFEPLDDTSFDALNNWVAAYVPLSKELSLTREAEQGLQSEAGNIVKVDFKAKTGTSGEIATIRFKDMVFGDGFSTPYNAEDIVTASITIGDVQNIPPIIVDTDPIPEDNGDDLTPIEVEDDKKEKPEEIPETGLSENVTYIILALLSVAVVFYINYKRFEKKHIRYVNVD